MSEHCWLSAARLERIKPYLPQFHGRPRVEDRRVISGMIHIIANGLRWRVAPEVYGPLWIGCAAWLRPEALVGGELSRFGDGYFRHVCRKTGAV